MPPPVHARVRCGEHVRPPAGRLHLLAQPRHRRGQLVLVQLASGLQQHAPGHGRAAQRQPAPGRRVQHGRRARSREPHLHQHLVTEDLPPPRGRIAGHRPCADQLAQRLRPRLRRRALDQRGQRDRPRGIGPVHLHRAGLGLRGGQRRGDRRDPGAAQLGDDPAALGRCRVQAERGLGDDAEGAVRAGEELAQVVARDVLDHLAAGSGDGAVGEHDRDADEQVAGGAVAERARPGQRGGQGAADRRVLAERHVQGQLLPLAGEGRVQGRHRHPGLGAHDQVAGGVLQHLVHAAQVEQDVAALGRRSPVQLRAAAGGHHREVALGAGAHDGGDLLDGLGQRDPARPHAAHGVVVAGLPGRHLAEHIRPLTVDRPFLTRPAGARPCARPAPRRTTSGWGRPCPGSPGPGGRTRTGRAASCPGRPR